MAIDTVAYTISALSHSAELFRRAGAFAMLGQSGGSAFGSAIKNPADFAVSTGGGMTVNVAAGEAEVFGTLSTAQGPYYCHNGATVNLAIASSDPTNPRIDVVCVTVQDSQYAGATDGVVLQVVTGTPAGSPSAPALPANSLALGNVLVPASSSSVTSGNITDKRASTAAPDDWHSFVPGLSTATGFTTIGTWAGPNLSHPYSMVVSIHGGCGFPSANANTSFRVLGQGGAVLDTGNPWGGGVISVDTPFAVHAAWSLQCKDDYASGGQCAGGALQYKVAGAGSFIGARVRVQFSRL